MIITVEEKTAHNVISHQCDSCALYAPLYVCLFGEYIEVSNMGSCMRENSDVAYMEKCVRYCDGCEFWRSAEKLNRRKKKINADKIALKKIANELIAIANCLKE